MNNPIATVEVFTLTQPRKVPYLGALREGEVVNPNGYIVRKGNRTVYPTFDRSVLVRMTTEAGVVGWGETYGIVAPGAVAALINDLLAGFVIGRDASDPSAIYDDLYDMMRVRGYTGGFYVDALAALDIALWDIAGQEAGKSVRDLLGGGVDTFPAYVSACLKRRSRRAGNWRNTGSTAVSTPSSSQRRWQTMARRPKWRISGRCLDPMRRSPPTCTGTRRRNGRWN